MARPTTRKLAADGSDKALTIALANLEKQYGKGIVMRGGDRPDLQVETFPSGSLGLDKALGVGGYPRGRIIEVYGPESSGKCLTGDTYVWTPTGMLTISELFSMSGLTPSCKSLTTECAVTLLNRAGVGENTTHFTHNNRKPVFEVKLADGSSVKSTANHPHLVMSKSGNWVWRTTARLQPGDYIVKKCGTLSGSLPAERQYDACAEAGNLNTMYALGALVADGCFSDARRISFTNNDEVVVRHVLSLMVREGFEVKSYPRWPPTTEYHFNGKDLTAAFMQKYGLQHGLAAEKRVPICVRHSETTDAYHRFVQFLRGYIECAGYFDVEKKRIEVTSASVALLQEVQQLLYYVGVRSSVAPKLVDGDLYYRLVIAGEGWNTYIQRIGCNSAVRRSEIANASPSHAVCGLDTIPHLSELLNDLYDASETTAEHHKAVYEAGGRAISFSKLQSILDLPWADCAPLRRLQEIAKAGYVYTEVTSVVSAGEEPTFDFAMSETHSFIANGIVTHNTTLTLHAIAEVQKLGGRAAFIDAEHAFDPAYAAKLGVNVDDLYFCQPDSGEQALEVCESLVLSGAFAVIVIDSVAALVPRAEIDGEMGDSHMGLQARLMSQALRKVTSATHKTNTTLFFINQLRMKIGVMFGNPETTTGGNALKFYASIRMDVRKFGNIKEGESVVGTQHRVKIVKNKVAPPFTQCEFEMRGSGVEFEAEVLDLGVAAGLIDKSGAWYSANGERIGQGRSNAIKFLKEHTTLRDEIVDKCRSKLDMPAVSVTEKFDEETGEYTEAE